MKFALSQVHTPSDWRWHQQNERPQNSLINELSFSQSISQSVWLINCSIHQSKFRSLACNNCISIFQARIAPTPSRSSCPGASRATASSPAPAGISPTGKYSLRGLPYTTTSNCFRYFDTPLRRLVVLNLKYTNANFNNNTMYHYSPQTWGKHEAKSNLNLGKWKLPNRVVAKYES